MADVRALLRAEQATRVTPAKPAQPSASTLGKRKADTEDDQAQKRSRARDTNDEDTSKTEEAVHTRVDDEQVVEPDPKGSNTEPTPIAVDQDEWAAFERDVATPPASPSRQTALDAIQSKATITAAPRTREEIEAQQKEEVKTQRAQREEDSAADQEEAARTLEDEFEEMEALEARVQKLKDMRETIRLRRPATEETVEDGPSLQDDDEDEEDEDYDDWGFGKR
jgi:hypothetical protein